MGQSHSESSTFFGKERGRTSSPNFHPGSDVQRPRGLEGPTHPCLSQRKAPNADRPPANVEFAFVPMPMHLGAPNGT